MENFALKVQGSTVEKGELGVFFLGQAGFLFKTSDGRLLAVDPYLSDCCERYFGFKRLMPHLLDAGELMLDFLVATHAHYDHFDPDSVPLLMANGHTEFVGAKDTAAECERLHLNERVTFVSVGESLVRDGIKLTAVPCDHGAETPHAIGLLIEAEGKRVYIMGDTCYRPDHLTNELLHGVDLLILPINGAFGNLNETEAAEVVSVLRPRLAVPCHYWNFAEHGGNPALFMEAVQKKAPDCPYFLMRQGEYRKLV